MTFLNFILLGGLAAASVPLIIHLLNRSRPRIMKWGAMHLLDAALKQNSRRLRIEHWILLLIRCAIPAILALCLARPVLTGMAALVGGARSSLVLLLDNSYSMDATSAGGSHFHQARDASTELLTGLGRGSDAAVVLMAGGVQPLMGGGTIDLPRLTKETKAIEGGFGSANIPEALEYSAGLLAKMQHPYREIVLLTDFQKVSWSEAEAPARSRAVELLQKMPIKPQLTLVYVGTENRDNVAVESLDMARVVFGVNQQVPIRANIHNFGERAYPELRVYFKVDGKERSAAQIALAGGEQQQVLFQHTFERAGSHVIEVSIDADPLKADNSLSASVPVWDQVPVLLVNGDPSTDPLKGETDFLEIALQPFGKAKSNLADLLTTQTIDPRDLNATMLTKQRVVVLANVRDLSNTQVKALTDFVAEGGGLFVFPGNKMNTEWYNRFLAMNGGLLPAPLAGLGGSAEASAPGTRIAAGNRPHPALELFNDPRNGNLADAEIKLWSKVRENGKDPNVSVLARYDNGDAFLLERRFGEGRVIFCTTTADADWSNLPVRPFYLPLMQSLATYLASSVYPPRNVDVGKPVAAFFSKADSGKKAVMLDPGGVKHDVPILARGARSLAEYTDTRKPGLYLLTGPDGNVIHFVVRTSRLESDLRQLTENERLVAAKSMGATLVKSVAEYRQLDQKRRFGRELWRPLFWAVLVLLFAELFVQQWFAKRK